MVNPRATARMALPLVLIAACGDQASTAYEGESLLTLQGKVELLDLSAEGPLVPALAFRGPHGFYRVQDVEVEGEFPTSFTLHAFDPPPEDTVHAYPVLDSEPRTAMAFITAAAAGHEPGFQYFDGYGRTPNCDLSGSCRRVRRDYCYSRGGGEGQEPLGIEDCYTEVSECPFEVDFEVPQDYRECEVVETEGDPELARDLGSHFYGLSLDYRVFYLDAPAHKGSLTARALGSRKGLDAGYHLVHARLRTPDEIDEAKACNDEATEAGFEAYRKDHPDTRCEVVPGFEDDSNPIASVVISCTGDSSLAPNDRSVKPEGAAIARYTAKGQADCPNPGVAEFEVVDSASTELSIRIGHGAGTIEIDPFSNAFRD